jgi:hypothetical protein
VTDQQDRSPEPELPTDDPEAGAEADVESAVDAETAEAGAIAEG